MVRALGITRAMRASSNGSIVNPDTGG